MLPTALATSTLSRAELWATLTGFTLIYGTLAVIEIGLVVRTVRRGPYASHEQGDFEPALLPGTPGTHSIA